MNSNKNIDAPRAEKRAHILEKFGDKRVDNYFWLNQREDPDVLNYLNKENDYFESILPKDGLRSELFIEMTNKIKKDDDSVPYLLKDYYYWHTFSGDSEYPIYWRKDKETGNTQQILNVNSLGENKEFCQVGGLSISTNNILMAYGHDFVGRRLYTIKFKNLITGDIYEDELVNTTGRFTWSNDNKYGYYTVKDLQTLRTYKIMKHVLGTKQEDDVCVYQEDDEKFYCGISKTLSEKYMIISSNSSVTSECRILNLDNEYDVLNNKWITIAPRMYKVEYSISHDPKRKRFIISTNLNAENFRLVEVDEGVQGSENWKDIVPHRYNVLLENYQVFDKYLILQERENGQVRLRVMNLDYNEDYYIKFNEEIYDVWISANYTFDTDILRIGYTSLTTPTTTYDYNLVTRKLTLLKEKDIPNFDKNNYRSKRIYAKSHDGKNIAISMVYHKNNTLKNTPLLLYGYGSYGSTMDPYVSIWRLPLLDRGFIFAIAHVRGSEYYGREWYLDGKFLNKKNTFKDFISCSEKLILDGYTFPNKLFALGGSAGGLLVGVVINMRPDLYKGVVAMVPFVDVLTTMLDETIPLTVTEYDEWGNPNDKEYYDYMKSYSPYDNVDTKNYPNLLITTGLHDSQVQYWEPAKWLAKLRELKTDNNKMIMHTDMNSGHGGASGRFKAYEEYSIVVAFMLNLIE